MPPQNTAPVLEEPDWGQNMPPPEQDTNFMDHPSDPMPMQQLHEFDQPTGPSETDLLVQKMKAMREAEKNKP